MAAEQFISVAEFAKLTGLSPATVHRYIRDGKITAHQPGGPRSRVLIPRDELHRRTHSAPPAAPTPAVPDPLPRAARPKLAGRKPRWLSN